MSAPSHKDLDDVRRNWDRFGRTDPYFAIASWKGKEGGGWDVEEFFATGREEIAAALQRADALERPARMGTALDFGCGAGRLTQALAERFETATGVDVARSMIRLAESHNRRPERCRFVLNERADLSIFDDATFDFVYTSVTLQHMPPALAKGYVAEFLRVLRPGGAAAFQLPYARVAPPVSPPPVPLWRRVAKTALPGALRERLRGGLRRAPEMQMHAVAREEVHALVASLGGRILDEEESPASGPSWRARRYWAAPREG